MTRKYRYLAVALTLLLALTACTVPAEETEPGYPTLPSFPLDRTPTQQLGDAIAKTREEGEYEVRYGTRLKVGEAMTEDTKTQAVSQNHPLDRDEIFAAVPDLPNREDFLERFCSRSLRVIPSNSGSLRFELAELSWEDARELLNSNHEELADGTWTIALTVDGAGRLSDFEMTLRRDGEIQTAFLTITFPKDP